MRTSYQQPTKPTLSCQALEALHTQYSRTEGHQSLNALTQGETDVLHLAREALGWPTIISLAHKYYPLYPNRQWWKRALERCSNQKVRTVTLNIKYLLLALATVKAMALKAAFSGKEGLNRLVHSTNNNSTIDGYRLVPGRQLTTTPAFGYSVHNSQPRALWGRVQGSIVCTQNAQGGVANS